MPSEVRYLVFSQEETVTALWEYYRKSGNPLPDHAALHLRVVSDTPPFALLAADAVKGHPASEKRVNSETLLSALVLYSIGKRIPLPARGTKSLSILHDRLAMVVALGGPAAKVQAI